MTVSLLSDRIMRRPEMPMTFRLHRRSGHGFTIIEALISSVIVALGMFATLSLLMFIRHSNAMEQERSRARQIIYQHMETARSALYSHLASDSTVTIWDNGTPENTSDDTQGILNVIVKDLAGTRLYAAPVPAVIVQVEVTLNWPPRGGDRRKRMQETAMTYLVP